MKAQPTSPSASAFIAAPSGVDPRLCNEAEQMQWTPRTRSAPVTAGQQRCAGDRQAERGHRPQQAPSAHHTAGIGQKGADTATPTPQPLQAAHSTTHQAQALTTRNKCAHMTSTKVVARDFSERLRNAACSSVTEQGHTSRHRQGRISVTATRADEHVDESGSAPDADARTGASVPIWRSRAGRKRQ